MVRVGLVFLTIAGVAEAMAAVFDINQTMYSVAEELGIIRLPVAAMLISIGLGRAKRWSTVRGTLLWTANLTWISVLLLAATFALLVVTFSQVPGGPPAQAPKVLPPGVIGLVGCPNRLIVVSYCAWVVGVAWHALRMTPAIARFGRPALSVGMSARRGSGNTRDGEAAGRAARRMRVRDATFAAALESDHDAGEPGFPPGGRSSSRHLRAWDPVALQCPLF